MKIGIRSKCLAILAVLCTLLASDAVAVNLQLVSVIDSTAGSPASGNGDSMNPVISPDGRFVLFASTANNLTATTNGNVFPAPFPSVLNVFLNDLASGTNLLVSMNAAGTGGGDNNSTPIAISTNGQFVLFESDAANLVNDDTNNASDIFVRDLLNQTTTLVSMATTGGVGSGASWGAVATPDGQTVAFASAATNLVALDTNRIPDVFVRDMQAGTTKLASVGARSTGSTTLPSTSESPVISADGRYVAFYSSATNLVPGVWRAGEFYVRDVVADNTVLASTNSLTPFRSTNAISCNLSISADGSYVAFLAMTNSSLANSARGTVLRYNPASGVTDLIHTNAFIQRVAYQDIGNLDMTPDGRFVAFVANVTGTSGTNTAIYLWDAQTGTNQLISANTNNDIPEPAFYDSPVVSSNGEFVAFLSTATGLVTNALAGEYHLYLRNVPAGTTRLLDVDTNGIGAGVEVFSIPHLSADGSRAVFESAAGGLVGNDRNRGLDVFMEDVTDSSMTLISARHPLFPSQTPNGLSTCYSQPVSQDGRFMVFASDADNLVSGDTNHVFDVFVHDLSTGSNLLVSVADSGTAGTGMSVEPAISGSGRFVAFTSNATNFFAGDTNNTSDVFIRDLQSGTTAPVSVDASGTGMGNLDSYSPTISFDGRYVLFLSKAGNLTANSTGTAENLFLRDRQTGTTYGLTGNAGHAYASMTPDGRFVAFADVAGTNSGKFYLWDSQQAARIATNSTAGGVRTIAISPDANRIVYFKTNGLGSLSVFDRAANTNRVIDPGRPGPRAGLRFSADSRWLAYAAYQSANLTNQVHLYDFLTQTNILVSHDFSVLAGANGSADSPDISSDGRFVAYRCAGNNLVPGDTNGVPDVFLYDAATGTNILLSADVDGNSANNRSLAPVFSGDGHALIFSSWASDLVANDFNHYGDVVAYEFLYAAIAESNGHNPEISWPSLPGQTFRVEYKNDLNDSLWQNISAPVIITGKRGRLTDPTPAPGRRFYRIVLEN